MQRSKVDVWVGLFVLLGEQYVGIEAGGDERNLAQGDVVTQTQSAVVLENLISQFLFNKAAEPAPPAAE